MKPNILPITVLLVFILYLKVTPSFGQGKGGGFSGTNLPPTLSSIPEQIIQLGDTFPNINLNDYLTEPEGDNVEFSYFYNNTLTNNESENWNYTNKSPSMTMLAKIKIRGEYPDASGDRIAAFHDGNIAGEGDAMQANGEWVFFLVIDGEQTYDSIYFQYFDASQSTTFEVKEKVEFISQLNLGDPSNPYVMNAGFVATKQDEIPTSGIFEPEIFNLEWAGVDTLYIVAQEIGTTELYSDTTMLIFRIQSNPLPLELLSFSATGIDFQSFLNWKIESPENVEGFEIQRSTPNHLGNLVWEKIDFVDFENQKYDYHYIDELPFRGLNYYRLKIKDNDGSFEYSPIVNVLFEKNQLNEIQVFPNPVMPNQSFFISLKTETPTDVQVQITHSSGQPLDTFQFFTNKQQTYFPIDIQNFASGIYFANIKIGHQVKSISFIVLED